MRLDGAWAHCSPDRQVMAVSLRVSNIGRDTFLLEVVASSALHHRIALELADGRLVVPRFVVAPGRHLIVGKETRLLLGEMSRPLSPGDTLALQVRLGAGMVADLAIPVIGIDSLLDTPLRAPQLTKEATT